MKRLIPFLLLACGAVHAQSYHADIVHGATNVLLPCIPLRALDDTPAGGTLETGIVNSTAGLTVNVRSDNSAGWEATYSQATSTINAKSGAIGSWETPDTNDIHWAEVASSAGCYQIDFPNSTWSKSGAKYVQIKIHDTSSPTFADTMILINLNVIDAATFVDNILDESCSGHTTSNTLGDKVCAGTDTTHTYLGGISELLVDINDGTTQLEVKGQNLLVSSCDSGTTTTCLDTAITETTTNYWVGSSITFTSGTINGQSACITGYDGGTKTLRFYPPTTSAISTNQYVLTVDQACRGN